MGVPKTMLSLLNDDPEYERQIATLGHGILTKGKVIVITGAGISVSSGIPVHMNCGNFSQPRISGQAMVYTIR